MISEKLYNHILYGKHICNEQQIKDVRNKNYLEITKL